MEMNWLQLLNSNRWGANNLSSIPPDHIRTDFQRDYDRVIFSSPFRRLQNKTQVFPLPGSIFVHNRLTHSLEVSSVGRSLGNSVMMQIRKFAQSNEEEQVGQLPTVVSAACLAHDLGNPPFGHSGEAAIRKYFTDNASQYKNRVDDWEWNDLTRFEGNANAIRLLTHQFHGRRFGGYRLSKSVLASIIKYPYPSTAKKKKFGYFKSEKEPFKSIAESTGLIKSGEEEYCRHPLAYLVEAADDICYQIMDIEDAHKLGILSTPATLELYRNFFNDAPASTQKNIGKTLQAVTDPNEQVAYLRAITINLLVESCVQIFMLNYKSIMNGIPCNPLVEDLNGSQKTAMEAIKSLAVKQVYNHRKVVEIEIAGFQIIGSLLDIFCQAVLNPKSGHSKKVIQLMPEQFLREETSSYERILSVLDFISGMTDIYALETYRLIKGIDLPKL
ncbi:MAG: deoxyguanosinetriphosphate triphosphohydrolase [Bacteroidales bacterium]